MTADEVAEWSPLRTVFPLLRSALPDWCEPCSVTYRPVQHPGTLRCVDLRRWIISALATGSAFALGIANNLKQPVWFVTSVVLGAIQLGAATHLGLGKGPLRLPRRFMIKDRLAVVPMTTYVRILLALVLLVVLGIQAHQLNGGNGDWRMTYVHVEAVGR